MTTFDTVTDLATECSQLADGAARSDDPAMQSAGQRLLASAVRPLGGATAQPADGKGAAGDPPAVLSRQAFGDSLLGLALRLTSLSTEPASGPGVAEAAAALQDLAVSWAEDSDRADLLDQVAARTAGIAPTIRVAKDGPLLATNVTSVTDRLGRDLPVRPVQALCRCGRSATKPVCDGSHAASGFSGTKDPNRVPDRRETYVGQQVTVFDNRGICQHSGFCTDRLATVFRLGEEPFVAASGGRMDEIIRAVRDCPSGALSYAVDGVEARGSVDHHGRRPPAIEVSGDGPYRITGAVRLIDDEGAEVARNAGASHEHYALCRCGQSQNKPFCSGMHYYVDFHDPDRQGSPTPTIFEWAGGYPAFLRMTRLFYEKHVPEDPLLAPIFSTMSADHPERVAKWLSEVFCGPARYSADHGGYPRMLSQHLGKCLTEEQRARWVSLLLRSAAEARLPNDAEFRSAFEAYIEWGSRLAVENSQTGAQPPEHMPMPRWDWNTAAGPPGSRISALAPAPAEEAPAPVLPGEGEPVGFAAHIKGLFRERDQRSMSFAFDLWSYEDVSTHGEAILGRLRAGTMPCDGPWPASHVDVFERWLNSGKRP